MSCECAKSELDLFAVPPTQTSVEHGQWIQHHPIASVTDNGPIEFFISGSGDEYIDLANTQLYVRAKITKADGSNLDANVAVAPANLWLHTMFSQLDVSLNEKLISPSTNTYSYRAYLENLLSYGGEAKKGHLTAALWYKDTAGKFDVFSDDNLGFKTRKGLAKSSGTVDMMGRLHSDLFFQDRYLLNNVDVKIRMVRSKDAFAINSTQALAGSKIKIEEASLFVRKVKLSPAVQMGHIKALEKSTAKYPIRRVDCKVFSIPAGHLSSTQENLFLGQVPKRVVIGFCDTAAYNGAYAKNCFNFKHYDINYLCLYSDGQQIPCKPLQPDFDKTFVRSYMSLFTGTGQQHQDEGNDIGHLEYHQGNTLFAFDLTPDLSDGSHFNLIKQGNLRVEVHFKTPLPTTINAVVYAEFENIIEIDRSRNVLFDFTP